MNEIGADPAGLSAILVTHEHTDHIKGINILSKKYRIPVYANAECWRVLQKELPDILPGSICVFENDRVFYIGNVAVFPFSTHHDAAHPVGFVISHRGAKAAVCTDTGHIDKKMLDALAGCGIVLIEANHDIDMLMAGGYPYLLKKRILSGNGHLCNDDCGKALVALYEKGVKSAILGHLSAENNYPELAMITVRSALEMAGIGDRMNIALALRDRPTGVFELQ